MASWFTPDPTDTTAPLPGQTVPKDYPSPTTAGGTAPGMKPTAGAPAAGDTLSDLDPNAPGSFARNAPDAKVAKLIADFIASNKLTASQTDPTALRQIVDYLRSQGINAQMTRPDSNGRLGGIAVNGQIYQLINGKNEWTALQPFAGGDNSSAGGTPPPQFNYPGWNETFQAPTGVTEENDPGYQARLAIAQQALERSAAAKGTLNTGGTLVDTQKLGQDYASNEYANVYNRAANAYNQRYQQYLNSFNNALTTFGTNFGVDTNLYGRAFNESQANWAHQYDLANLGLGASSRTTQGQT